MNFGSTLKIQSKLANKGRLCMHLGQAVNHPRDTYRFLNLATDRVILSRDVRWLGKVYGTYHSIPSIELADADEDLRSIADSAAPGGVEESDSDSDESSVPQDAVNQQSLKSKPVKEQQGVLSSEEKEQRSLDASADESSTTAVNGDEPLQPKSPDESMEIVFEREDEDEREDDAEDEETTSTKSQQTRPTVLTRNSKYAKALKDMEWFDEPVNTDLGRTRSETAKRKVTISAESIDSGPYYMNVERVNEDMANMVLEALADNAPKISNTE